MKLYFLVEGRRSEPQIYRRWLKCVLPDLREVRHASELSGDGYRLRSAGGYPGILDRIGGSVEEVRSAGIRLDEFFVCLDSEEQSYDDRLAEVERVLQELSPPFRFTVVVQNCCIETWLLGDRSLLRPPPKTQELRGICVRSTTYASKIRSRCRSGKATRRAHASITPTSKRSSETTMPAGPRDDSATTRRTLAISASLRTCMPWPLAGTIPATSAALVTC